MSNHLGDTNKMVGDTPRTDAHIEGLRRNPQVSGCDSTLDFSRQLERELNAAKSKIELLMSANADVARIAGERDAAEKRIRLLIAERDTAQTYADQKWKLRREFHDLFGTDDVEQGVAAVRKYQNRIKRLEEENNELRAEEARLLNTNGELNRRIKRLEDRIHRASMAFFRDGSDGHIASQMLQILEEERRKQ